MGLMQMVLGFGARDVGAAAGQGKAIRQTETLLDRVLSLGRATDPDRNGSAGASVRAMMDSLSHFTAANLTSGMNALTDSGSNLTNSLEAEMAGYEVTGRRTVAMLGLTGEAASQARAQISGLAYGLRVGADTVASNLVAIHEASSSVGDALSVMGLDLESLTKVTEVFGIQGNELTSVLGDLTQSWGFSSEAAADYLDTMVATAQSARVGRESFGLIRQSLQAMDEAYAASGLERTPEDIRATSLSIVRLSGALREFGVQGDDLQTTVGTIFQTMAREQTQFERGFVGQGEVYGDLSTALMEALGPQMTNQLMRGGVDDLVSNLNSLFMRGEVTLDGVTQAVSTNASTMQRLRGSITDTLGPAAAFMVTSENGATALANMVQPATDAAGALRGVGEAGYSSGITLQESLDRARDIFDTRLRGITRGPVRDFVGHQIRAYDRVADRITELAESDSVWAPLIQRFSAISQVGIIGALIPLGDAADDANSKWGRLSAVLELGLGGAMDAVNSLVPFAHLLSGFGPMLSGMFGWLRPIAAMLTSWPVLLGAGIVALALYGDEIQGFVDKGLGVLAGWTDKVSDWMDSLDGAELAGKLADFVVGIPGKLVDFFSGAAGSEGGQAFGDSVKRFLLSAFTLGSEFFGELGGRIMEGLESMWTSIHVFFAGGDGNEQLFGFTVALNEAADSFFEWVTSIDWGGWIVTIGGTIRQGLSELPGMIGNWWSNEGGDEIVGGLLLATGKFLGAIGVIIGEVAAGVGMFTVDLVVGLWNLFWGAAEMLGDKLAEIGRYVINDVKVNLWDPLVMWIGDKSLEMAAAVQSTVTGWVGGVSEWFSGVKDTISAVFDENVVQPISFVLAGVAAIFDATLIEPWRQAFAFWSSLYDTITTSMQEYVIAPLDSLADRMLEAGRAVIGNVITGFQEKLDEAIEFIHGGLQRIRDLWPGSEPRDQQSPLRRLADAGQALLENVQAGFSAYIEPFTSAVSGMFGTAADTIMDSFIARATLGAVDRMQTMVDGLSTSLITMLNAAAIVPLFDMAPTQSQEVQNILIGATDIKDVVNAIMFAHAEQKAVLDVIAGYARVTAENTGRSASSARVVALRGA